MEKKLMFLLVSFCFIFLDGIFLVSAVRLGVSPANIEVDLNSGESLVKKIHISGDSGNEIELSVEGDIKDLVNLSENNFVLDENGEQSVGLVISVSEDLDKGIYSGKINIKGILDRDAQEEIMGQKISSSLDVNILVNVLDKNNGEFYWFLIIPSFLIIVLIYYSLNKFKKSFQ